MLTDITGVAAPDGGAGDGISCTRGTGRLILFTQDTSPSGLWFTLLLRTAEFLPGRCHHHILALETTSFAYALPQHTQTSSENADITLNLVFEESLVFQFDDLAAFCWRHGDSQPINFQRDRFASLREIGATDEEAVVQPEP